MKLVTKLPNLIVYPEVVLRFLKKLKVSIILHYWKLQTNTGVPGYRSLFVYLFRTDIYGFCYVSTMDVGIKEVHMEQ